MEERITTGPDGGLWFSEIDAPGAIGRLHGDGSVTELTGRAATEEAFKALAPGKRLLHIATHGFFVQERCQSVLSQQRLRGTSMAKSAAKVSAAGDNPLLLSGLTLAGANRPAGGAAAALEDGFLTAEEIGALDLKGVAWAVLSACETGVGKVVPGEGVLGLRRAFAVAGAGTLIMSLWRVEDDSTREWMQELYRGRRARHSTALCVTEASRAMIRERTSGGADAARAAGRVGGRRKKLDDVKRRDIAESVISGRKTGAEMARSTASASQRCRASWQPTQCWMVDGHPMVRP